MPLDIGYIGVQSDDGVTVRIFYQRGFTPGAGQTYMDAPLVDNADPALGPTGYCLLVINTTGVARNVTVSGVADIVANVRVPQGNPVTTGNARSRTAAQLKTAGLSKRGDVTNLALA
jgi:hypothetical protein